MSLLQPHRLIFSLFDLNTRLGDLVEIGLLYPPIMFQHDLDGVPQPFGNRMKSKLAILSIQEVCFKRSPQIVDQFAPK